MVRIKITSAYVMVAIAVWMVLEPTLAAKPDVSFDIEGATIASYSQLLTDVRNIVRDRKIVYGGRPDLPVMAKPSAAKNYLYVDLTASGGRTITIAVNLRKDYNLYVVAYLDKINGNFRSHIFKDFAKSYPADAEKNLFPEAKVKADRLVMHYESNYAEVESKAGSRANLGLGKQPLILFFNKVYGQPIVDTSEARFMLVVMQMLSEATRFAYIERMIVENFEKETDECYKPDFKTIEFEKTWKKITVGIKNSKGGEIKPPLDLKDPEDNPWPVSSVEEIARDMGLLKNEGATTTANNRVSLALVINKLQRHFNQFISFFKANNGDDDYEAEL
ncbi:ribosome-inactivating protein PD-L3/PD-L4-like [Chenopodium quinoa]|uniref:ribosome-inactivating protein PD-L3/PD-L4-like n=1 Tax=Chenopodium quinoa TaxID=63459 RepID=UPI000B7888F5|nr:ribosome-inactivating protein PD-L3/PD-L4-like [Chenopodium quinoa]XP_021743447.1 ribosome-inactivating protein PD-L3/PD-L4-like [Chenopodium quinoa]